MAARFGLEREIVDEDALRRSAAHLREARVLLPTFAQLARPEAIPGEITAALGGVDPDSPHPLNLFRVHWLNDAGRRGRVAVPDHLEVPEALTGVPARIVLALGNRFPMIRAHKVLAAYACLIPRLVTGRFDATRDRALWPSTGNYCRGGVAISRILGCRGVAILPEGMSEERFRWLERWVADPADVMRTPGTESNVREIYELCDELAREPRNVVINQFSEFPNHLAHTLATGDALERVLEALQAREPQLRLRAFVSATGSAGTIGAGDPLKERFGARIVAAEALECPTMLRNGYGAHNIQGIGDKHIPLIHNVMNTDIVTAISDRHTDRLNLLFNSDEGRAFLHDERKVPRAVVDGLADLGLSSICNLLAAIRVAKHLDLGAGDVVLTIATDGADLYGSERQRVLEGSFPGGFRAGDARALFAESILGIDDDDDLLELSTADRQRIFNLGYFTWVEQRGVSVEDFDARREQGFWRELRSMLDIWDRLIEELNERTGVRVGGVG